MPHTDTEYARLMSGYAQIFSFLVGICVGSFLNVVIARVPEGLSIVRPGSRCPRCLNGIAWYDNLPLLSWLILRGRCRHCKLPISPRYPTVELLVGLLALALERQYGVTPLGILLFLFVCVLVVVSYIDLDFWIIPLEVVIPGIAFGIISSSVFNPSVGWLGGVIGAVGGFAVFAAIAGIGTYIFKRPALGQGDWWLIAMIGAFLGWKALLPVILLASLQGSIVGILLIVVGKNERGEAPVAASESAGATPAIEAPPAETSPAVPDTGASADGQDDEDDWVPPQNAVPFGPFLALGALEQLFLGDWLRDLWWHIFSGLKV